MRAQPGLAVVAPAASEQVGARARARCSRFQVRRTSGSASSRSRCPALTDRFELGRAQQLGDGDDVALVVAGRDVRIRAGGVPPSCSAARASPAGVVVVSCVSPAAGRRTSIGVLGSVPLALSRRGPLRHRRPRLAARPRSSPSMVSRCRLVRAGVRDLPLGISGGRDYMHEHSASAPSGSPRRWSRRWRVHRRSGRRGTDPFRPRRREALGRHRLLPGRASRPDHARAAGQGVHRARRRLRDHLRQRRLAGQRAGGPGRAGRARPERRRDQPRARVRLAERLHLRACGSPPATASCCSTATSRTRPS